MIYTSEEKARLKEFGFEPPIDLRYISILLGYLHHINDKMLKHKLITEGVRLIRENGLDPKQAMDCHFIYMQALQFYYRHREEEKGLDNAKYFCIQQIKLAESSAAAFRREYEYSPLPSHTGYEQLCIVYHKEGKYQEVMQLCQQAKKQGWNGDWDKRYARAEKKLQKGK